MDWGKASISFQKSPYIVAQFFQEKLNICYMQHFLQNKLDSCLVILITTNIFRKANTADEFVAFVFSQKSQKRLTCLYKVVIYVILIIWAKGDAFCTKQAALKHALTKPIFVPCSGSNRPVFRYCRSS